MTKPFYEMTYSEMQGERKRILEAMRDTKSPCLRRDYYKYLRKIDGELDFYKKHLGRINQ